MKILLAYISGETSRRDPYISLIPTGVCSLHAVLRDAGFDAVLANFSGWTKDKIAKQLSELTPDIVGISQWTHNRHASMELAQIARTVNRESFIMMGGVHATFSYATILSSGSPVNCVVLGEGEETVLELVDRIQQQKDWHDVCGIACLADGVPIATAARPPLKSLDTLPFGVSFLEHSIGVDIPLQSEFIITTRGCPSGCYFCSSPQFWNRKVRFRSPENIVKEIEYVRNRYGLIYFSIRDDTFTIDRERTIAFCKMLIDRGIYIIWNCQSRVTTLDEELLVWMKRAGCECIQLGVESGSEKVLARLNKAIAPHQVEIAAAMIKKVGISLSIYLITDIPGETEEDIQKTLDLVKRIRPDDGYVSPLAYFPGTRLYEDAVIAGLVAKELFETAPESALFALTRQGGNSSRILKHLANAGNTESEHFRKQKELLGFCFITNIMAGEFYRQRGEYAAAERELSEIVEQEALNPWGWYLLAELYSDIGRVKKAMDCYGTVLKLVPGHGPSLAAMQAKKRRS